jgi:para-aminobenzoate synthetase component I
MNNLGEKWEKAFNDLGAKRKPFVFIIDFDMKKVLVSEQLISDTFRFNFGGIGNSEINPRMNKAFNLLSHPLSYDTYKMQFDEIIKHLNFGNTFLLNLTHRTPIEVNLSLQEIYENTRAKYKFLYKDKFVFFSPETFIKIVNNRIYTYPMKGTIDASIPKAKTIILKDEKEIAEHYTIVDLLRNDLSLIAKNVSVDKFRYLEKIKTGSGQLIQVSSEISGKMNSNWHENLGTLLRKILPAGSISGAPKSKTIEITRKVEGIERGYYSGICGFYDGENLDTGVCIRFIEKDQNQLYYRSGSGITHNSKADLEYAEMIKKIYIPIS